MSITLITGPMFSGKTTELLRMLERSRIAKKTCLLIKWAEDDRYDCTRVVTHDKRSATASLSCTALPDITEVVAYDVVGIDEGQFFPGLAEFCDAVANAGSEVFVAALDGTYQREPFPAIAALIPLAEFVKKIHAVCVSCGRLAAYSVRQESAPAVTGTYSIGGTESYKAVCRACLPR